MVWARFQGQLSRRERKQPLLEQLKDENPSSLVQGFYCNDSQSSSDYRTMKFYEFLELCGEREELLEYLIGKNVILGEINCQQCNNIIRIDKSILEFRCRKSNYVKNRSKKRVKVQCSFKQSARLGTWFQNNNVPVDTVCRVAAYFLCMRHPRLQYIMDDMDLSKPTAIQWQSLCRDTCIYWAEQNSTPIGGPGITVEIDEAKFGRRKYNRGRLVEGKWVFGGFERGSKKIFLVPVPDRTEQTLLAIIRQWILPGSTIIADCWKSCRNLNSAEFQHLTVNNRYNFVDPGTGGHTQHIKRTWREVRSNIPRYGTPKVNLVGYLAEYLFKRAHCRDDLLGVFWDEIAKLYPPKIHVPAQEDEQR